MRPRVTVMEPLPGWNFTMEPRNLEKTWYRLIALHGTMYRLDHTKLRQRVLIMTDRPVAQALRSTSPVNAWLRVRSDARYGTGLPASLCLQFRPAHRLPPRVT